MIAWEAAGQYAEQGAGFSVAHCSVKGVWRFVLYDGDELVGAFDDENDAKEVAEFLLERRSAKEAA